MNQGIHINDIFMWTHSVEDIRKFYSGSLGLEHDFYEPDKTKFGNAYIVYKFGDQSLHFINRIKDHIPVNKWTYQQSSQIEFGVERISFTIEMPRAQLETAAKKIIGSDIPHYQDSIEHRVGYSALTVRDPMGNTLDLYYKHKKT